jgi:hypothetical protein
LALILALIVWITIHLLIRLMAFGVRKGIIAIPFMIVLVVEVVPWSVIDFPPGPE